MSPVKLATGFAKLDAVIQGAWYQVQLDRMGRGLAPDFKASRLLAVLNYLGARRGTTWQPTAHARTDAAARQPAPPAS